MWILMGFDEDEFRITEFLDENVVNPQPFPYVWEKSFNQFQHSKNTSTA